MPLSGVFRILFLRARAWFARFVIPKKNKGLLVIYAEYPHVNVNVKCKCNLFTHEAPKSSIAVRSRSSWNLEMLVLWRDENRRTRRKTSRSKDENQQQTQPTYDAESRNRTRATLVGDECSHHCAIPAPPIFCKESFAGLQKIVVFLSCCRSLEPVSMFQNILTEI